MKMQFNYYRMLVGAVTFTFLLSSCGGSPEAGGYQQSIPEVDFITLKPTHATTEKKYPGTIEGTVNVDVKAQVTGYLDAVLVKEGDYVQKGQSLFKIKDEVYNEQVSNSQATLTAALAAEASALIEVEKMRPLVEGKVVSAVQLQTAEANLAAARAQIAQAKAGLGSAQINAGFTLIKAPVSGYIGRIPNRIGNLITPADAIPLTTLSEINQVWVYFSLSETDFITFMKDRKEGATGNTVALVMADGSVYPHPGQLELASGNISRTTGSMAIKALFPNPDKLLRSGGTGKIILKKSFSETLTIPMAGVKDIQNKYFVYVLGDSNTVQMQPVEIAGRAGDTYLLKSGLKEGDKIAVNMIDVLNDKMAVSPSTEK